MKPSDYFTPEYVQLIKLIDKGKKEQAQALIKQGFPLDIYGEHGITPLFWFIAKNDLEGTKLTLELGADPNLPETQYGDTPLNSVVGGETKYDVWITLLLEYGADPNIVNRNDRPPLFGAVTGSSFSQVDILLKYGADINFVDKTNSTAALYAAAINNFEMTYYLIERGTDYRVHAQTGADIAWRIYHSSSRGLVPESGKPWVMKIKSYLESQGVQFPPPSPAEVRAQWAKEGRYD